MKGPARILLGGFVPLPVLICAVVWLAGTAQTRAAAPVTLSNNNSTAQLDISSPAGMYNWSVQGQNQLAQQWFFYRVGNTPEQPISAITSLSYSQLNARSLSAVYTVAGSFSIQVDYLLTGGAFVLPGQTAVAALNETITINNLSGSVLDFHFFQYSDFDLGGSANDTIQLGKDLDGLFNEAKQTDGLAGVTEKTSAFGANHGEAGIFNATLLKLNDGVADNLNDGAGPLGPGDATWALQWDSMLDPMTSVVIPKTKNLSVTIVPEPSSLALIAAGLAGLVLCGLRKRRSA